MGKTTKTRRRSSHTNSSATVEQHDQLHDESLDGHDQTNQESTFTKMLEIQQQIFQKCLQSFMETTNTRFDNFLIDTTKTIAELKQSLQYTQHEVEDLKTQMSKNQPLNTADVACMKEQLRRVEDNIDYIENQSRRNNVRIDGIPEEANETWEQTEEMVKQQMTKTFSIPQIEVDQIKIERAHRTGASKAKDGKNKPRTIMVKFTSFKDRELLLQKARQVKPRGIFVNEDYSSKTLMKRKELIPKMMALRAEGKYAYISFDKLVVKDHR